MRHSQCIWPPHIYAPVLDYDNEKKLLRSYKHINKKMSKCSRQTSRMIGNQLSKSHEKKFKKSIYYLLTPVGRASACIFCKIIKISTSDNSKPYHNIKTPPCAHMRLTYKITINRKLIYMKVKAWHKKKTTEGKFMISKTRKNSRCFSGIFSVFTCIFKLLSDVVIYRRAKSEF